MSVSNIIEDSTSSLPSIPPLPPLRESPREVSLSKQNLFLQDSAQVERASAFMQLLERHLSLQEGNQSPLQILLKHAAQLSKTDANTPVIAAITEACFKQEGYFARLFSKETWEEWTENRTSLGKIAALFMDCVTSQTQIRVFEEKFDKREIQQANKKAEALLKRFNFNKTTTISNRNVDTGNIFQFPFKSSCTKVLLCGMVASIATKNPVPFLMGLYGCVPGVSAQQKIGTEFQVNTYTNNSQKFPSVASFSNGNFVMTWESNGQDGDSYGIYGQLFDGNGSNIGSEFRANSYSTDTQRHSSVASFSNGNFVVTWMSYEQDGSYYGVYGQLFDGNSSKIESEFRANSVKTASQSRPSVASFSNDNFVVTWDSWLQDGSDYGIFGQLFDGNATKIGSEFQANSRITDYQSQPSVASFNNGNFVVTWQSGGSQDGSGYGVYGQLFDRNGTKTGSEFRANSYSNSNQDYPSVASFSNGNFVVTWQSTGQDGSGFGVYGQLFDGNGSKIGSEFRANSYTTDDQRDPSVASFSNGNFVVTWHSDGQDGSFYGVFGQLFDGNGTKIGSEFRANSYRTSDQRFPSVASLANGNFVVTWNSDGQDGSNYGVYGQLFNDFLITSSTDTSTTSTSITTSTSTFASFTRPISSVTSSTLVSPVTSTAFITITTKASTLPSSITSTFASPAISTSPRTSRPKRSRSILWISLGVGGLICFCVTPIGLFLLRRRRLQAEPHFSESRQFAKSEFTLEPVVHRAHKVIGRKFFQLSTLVREEAEEIYLQTGHLIPFPGGQKKFSYVIGSGQFGKIKVAQRITDGEYVASKKVKGEENIRASEAEAQMQKAASGANVLPIYNTIQLEDALYHFMPLAGLGDGMAIQRRLALINQSPLAWIPTLGNRVNIM